MTQIKTGESKQQFYSGVSAIVDTSARVYEIPNPLQYMHINRKQTNALTDRKGNGRAEEEDGRNMQLDRFSSDATQTSKSLDSENRGGGSEGLYADFCFFFESIHFCTKTEKIKDIFDIPFKN